jgi:hypothetical protein
LSGYKKLDGQFARLVSDNKELYAKKLSLETKNRSICSAVGELELQKRS